MLSFNLPPLVLLGPLIGAVLVYLFLRVQVWSAPEAKSVESHGLWVGIIGWMASSLQAAMNTGILKANPSVPGAPVTPEQIFPALAWPVVAALAVHALGQWSYPAPKAPRRYAELRVRRIRDLLPRRLALWTAVIFGYAAVAIAWIATLPAYNPALPTPAPPQGPEHNGYAGQGQDGRIPGWELSAWLGGSLLVLAIGTWLCLMLIAHRRQLETLDTNDNRVLRSIAANRLLRTVATIAAGLAAIAGNFASLPQPGTTWQSSWFNLLGLANVIVLLVMWWWKVPVLSSLQADRKTTSAASLRSDPGTPGAARISVSLGPVVGIAGILPLISMVIWAGYIPATGGRPLILPVLVAVMATSVLLVIIGGELLTARNYGNSQAPGNWPQRVLSRGLLAFAVAAAALWTVAVILTGIGQALVNGAATWPLDLLITVGVSAVGAAAILTARFRRGIAGDVSRDGLDSALRAIAMYRIIRTLAAYFLAEAGAVLLTNPEAWGTLIPWSDNIAPGPSMLIGALLAATAVVTAVTPVRSLLGRIPRNNDDKQSQPTL
ncbi:hypothetical protein [Paenarthrobacter sp. YJN-5]|uniref:hypothetical protein n=1 Tax=Paenarthrobacter sp. YJN-5 TaxID=2735316 RepID=UPI001877C4E5|nr:hypothetical protein [Paenarthrobacter sp. YJN-5]QOT16182.1 hypothetical protein HMI59_05925 [Paenarthrobacter sp. YJN-5]